MQTILEKIKNVKMVPVIALERVEDAVPLARALTEGGLPCAEVTFRFPDADKCIMEMKKACPEMFVGAGTVLTKEQVDAALAAGAEFIVSPGLNPEVVQYCLSKNVPILPGCATPSDIEKALSLGLTCVKFFPAEANGGVKMLKALSAPYNKVTFMPTGGISDANMNDYYALKNVIACGGSFMVPGKAVKEGDWETITALTKKVVTKLSGKAAEPVPNSKSCLIGSPSLADKRVITFGELMLRLAPEGYYRFLQADTFQATFGGGEANVAVSLANYGMDAAFVSKLPKHEIGQMAVNSLRKFGVDTSMITRGGDRVGIYYLEKGASQRPSKVIYDRAGSAIATASKTDFNWDAIFEGAGWFHFTGITPALSDELAAICEEACIAAKERGIVISCDLNYRNKLWSKEKAGEVMGRLCKYVDVCIANEEDASDVFGIKASNTDITGGTLSHEGYKDVARQLAARFGFSYVAITLRESLSANDNNWAAMLYDTQEFYFSKKYPVHIVDRVGGGDSFGAGLIYAMAHAYAPADTIEFAVAASCLKHAVEGDYNMVSVDEVKKLAGGDASGRVQR
ncbi:MAG: bifunctional 4-hydroxy-2-oxoglutarate aldolase/2-dehydro-3-deoxy-phosphogluconate aldolase [Lachnospiraceae bacterium]|nr:bifunctional 4-hydroxy-2-oxoglutarate aldolase/2-dehydro-3-deoxy-phosphogluconate aldolase [Lachnospiraceae bacterium]